MPSCSVIVLVLGVMRTLSVEPDSFTLGGNRFDAPERIRGLHLAGDSAGAPIRITVGNRTTTFYLWALDTRLDGVERYDRIAISFDPDVGAHPELLIPSTSSEVNVELPYLSACLQPQERSRSPVSPGASAAAAP